MRTTSYLAGIAVCAAGLVALLLGVRSFYAAMLFGSGSLLAASSAGWRAGRRVRILDFSVLGAACAYLLHHTYTEPGSDAFAGFRVPWIGIPVCVAMVTIGVLQARAAAARNRR